jgi:beta-lactamase class C
MIFPVLLLALARGSVADIGMDAKVRHIVTADLAPETVGKAGGLAVAVYAAGTTTTALPTDRQSGQSLQTRCLT